MAKRIKKSCKAGKVNKKQKIEQEAMEIAEKGEIFGNNIIGQMSLTATGLVGIGAAVVGLAKAYAALKNISKCMDIDIESFFEQELSFFDDKFDDLLDLEELN